MDLLLNRASNSVKIIQKKSLVTWPSLPGMLGTKTQSRGNAEANGRPQIVEKG